LNKAEKLFEGAGVSPGIAVGHVLKIDRRNRVAVKIAIPPEAVAAELARFERAIESARERLVALKQRLEEMLGRDHSYILDAHLLMLEDKSLLSEITGTIREAAVNAEWAVRESTDRLRRAYEALEDPYFRERGSDIESVVQRILAALEGDRPDPSPALPDDLIVVGRDLDAPSFVAIGQNKVRGLVLQGGGRTSHTAIIARSLRIPAVMDLRKSMLGSVRAGDLLLVDGDAGQVVVHPKAERLERARARISSVPAESVPGPTAPLFLADGSAIALKANVELPLDVRAARQLGAEGIGLFRSELLFFAHPHGFPTVEEQLETYRMLVEEMAPHPVAVRTLDADPERLLGRAEPTGHAGSVMGLRGIRLSLRSPRARHLLEMQLQAIVRASAFGPLEVVLPMVSSVDEILEVKRMLSDIRAAGFSPANLPLGIMVETPAAALSLDLLAREADFLCIGTNDLIQFTLAVDRTNPEVSDLYQPLHPSILHSLRHVAEVAAAQRKPVRICGEVSANPLFAILLVGMGFEQLSMNTYSIPAIRKVLSALTIETARTLAARSLELPSAHAVAEYLVDAAARALKMDLSSSAGEIGSWVDSRKPS
jgi:phosphotransferase system enzyme I (PtsI)